MTDANFKLDDVFIEQYRHIPAPFGFNGVGEFTYRRCVTIDTPVLCADFIWRSAGNLRTGQAIIAFDEEIRPGTKERNLCIAYVTDNIITDEKCVEIELEDGQKLYSTADHPWLANRYTNNQKLWVQAKDLEKGPRGTAIALPQFFDVVEPDKSYMAGYLAAAFDGEGSFDGTSGLCYIQVENAMLKTVGRYLSEKGFAFKVKSKKNYGTKGSYESNQQCYEVRLTGGREQIFRFLMLVRPKRLMDVFLSKIDTVTLRCNPKRNKKVVAVRDAGERPIAVLSTTARTHFTAGYPSHNTYSRVKPDGTNEEWFETIRRVVEGCYRMQERHIKGQDLGWSNSRAQASAQEMYDRMFQMKFLPPGRGLWAMGSTLTEGERPLHAALNNCGFISTKNIDKDPLSPFAFLMDMSMLGVGVGFDVRGEGKLTIQEPGTAPKAMYADILKKIYPDQRPVDTTTDYLGNPVEFNYLPAMDNSRGEVGYTYTIPDTREGWVLSTLYVLNGFFRGTPIPRMDYSQIRPHGLLIKGFGGLSSGPEPLRHLHEELVRLLTRDIGKLISDENIVDIFNLEGCCVVAGNVRRSAEIAFGNPKSKSFLKLKDYKWDKDSETYVGPRADRSSWGWCSNNSIFAGLGMDYTEVGDQTGLNGEPGYAWLENMRMYGRMGDPINWIDKDAEGGNPCLEQTLYDGELCNLAELFPFRATSKEDFLRTIKFAYLYAKTVTLGRTHWRSTNKILLKNRRIGLSMSGIQQFVAANGLATLKTWCEEGYATVQKYDKTYSDWFCIPRSNKTTSIKPSGTISLVVGATPGMHWMENVCFKRRICVAKGSALLPPLIEAGYHVEDSVTDPSTCIVTFPVKVADNLRPVHKVSMWEQLSMAAFLQKHWADNQVSCTVTFDPETEAHQIKYALEYFQYQLKGVSFLPKTEAGAFAQMPYEEITLDEYDALMSNIKPLNMTGRGEEVIEPDRFCDGAKCTISR